MKSIEEYSKLEEYILDFSDFNQKNKYFKITRDGEIIIKSPSYILELAYIYFKGNKKSKEFLNFEDIVKLKNINAKYKEYVISKSDYNIIRYEKLGNYFIRLISNSKDNEVISIVIDKNDKSNNNINNNKWEVFK